MPQAAYESGRLPVAMRSRADAALPFGRSSVAPHHTGRCPGFIEEYKLFHVQARLRFKPFQPRRLHLLAFLFAGVQGFF
jgi:hypothetical protein